jgi:hydrogen peroxide-dependent heme synthase
MTDASAAHPPETLEGWYALHQVFRLAAKPSSRDKAIERLTEAVNAEAARALNQDASGETSGWSRIVRLIGSRSDVMVMHFRASLDQIGAAEQALKCEDAMTAFELTYSFLSVAEAGLYHITAELERDAVARGGKVGDEEYARAALQRAQKEKTNAYVARRLYPTVPADMPYVCFYPMSKRRNPDQNWYTLTLAERSRLMLAHGMIGRRFAGRVQQIITGAIGFEAWEWGVTLFARDPLDFKKLVTDMRFDETSAKYAEFGDFFVGNILTD